MGETTCVFDFNDLPVVFRYPSGGQKTRVRRNQHRLTAPVHTFPKLVKGFSQVEPGCDLVRLDGTSHSHERLQDLTPRKYANLLFTTLEVGFRLARPGHWPAVHLNHTSHHDQMFETAFSSDDDEVIADAVCVWIADSDRTPAGSLARYFVKRVERTAPFSPKLRQMGIHAIRRTWPSELAVSGLETVRLLNGFDVDVDDVEEKYNWVNLLVGVIRSPMGFENLSSHYWRLLDKLASTTLVVGNFSSRDMEVMKLLEEAEDWEKLEAWMVVVWTFLPFLDSPAFESVEGIERMTFKLVFRRPPALQRFEAYVKGTHYGRNMRPNCK